jgi:hypothetical protein
MALLPGGYDGARAAEGLRLGAAAEALRSSVAAHVRGFVGVDLAEEAAADAFAVAKDCGAWWEAAEEEPEGERGGAAVLLGALTTLQVADKGDVLASEVLVPGKTYVLAVVPWDPVPPPVRRCSRPLGEGSGEGGEAVSVEGAEGWERWPEVAEATLEEREGMAALGCGDGTDTTATYQINVFTYRLIGIPLGSQDSLATIIFITKQVGHYFKMKMDLLPKERDRISF